MELTSRYINSVVEKKRVTKDEFHDEVARNSRFIHCVNYMELLNRPLFQGEIGIIPNRPPYIVIVESGECHSVKPEAMDEKEYIHQRMQEYIEKAKQEPGNMDCGCGPMSGVQYLNTIEAMRCSIKKGDGSDIPRDEMLEALDAAAGALREQIGRAYGDTLPVNFVFQRTEWDESMSNSWQDVRIAELEVPKWLLGGGYHLVGMEEANG